MAQGAPAPLPQIVPKNLLKCSEYIRLKWSQITPFTLKLIFLIRVTHKLFSAKPRFARNFLTVAYFPLTSQIRPYNKLTTGN